MMFLMGLLGVFVITALNSLDRSSADCVFTGHQPSGNMTDASLESSVACVQL